MAGKVSGPILGAIAGAALVALLALSVGALLSELASPAITAGFALLGAVLGAYAWGAVAYDRRQGVLGPSADYTDGILASAGDPEPPRASGLAWLIRRRAGSVLKLPLTPFL